MWVRTLAVALGTACVLAGCGHGDPEFGSPEAIATAIGCRELLAPTNLPTYRRETCEYHGHRVAISWFPRDGESTGFMYASRGDGFVLGSRWLVKCWHGEDCHEIQRKVGGRAYVSTGPVL